MFKVYELENEKGVLVPVICHYFCSEQCMDKFLAPVERLWSEISPEIGEEIDKCCVCCGESLSV